MKYCLYCQNHLQSCPLCLCNTLFTSLYHSIRKTSSLWLHGSLAQVSLLPFNFSSHLSPGEARTSCRKDIILLFWNKGHFVSIQCLNLKEMLWKTPSVMTFQIKNCVGYFGDRQSTLRDKLLHIFCHQVLQQRSHSGREFPRHKNMSHSSKGQSSSCNQTVLQKGNDTYELSLSADFRKLMHLKSKSKIVNYRDMI